MVLVNSPKWHTIMNTFKIGISLIALGLILKSAVLVRNLLVEEADTSKTQDQNLVGATSGGGEKSADVTTIHFGK